jgi:hypothetical protein
MERTFQGDNRSRSFQEYFHYWTHDSVNATAQNGIRSVSVPQCDSAATTRQTNTQTHQNSHTQYLMLDRPDTTTNSTAVADADASVDSRATCGLCVVGRMWTQVSRKVELLYAGRR